MKGRSINNRGKKRKWSLTNTHGDNVSESHKEGVNGVGSLDGMFKTIAKSKWNKDRLLKHEFESLKGPLLHSSKYLSHLYEQDNEQYESILDHMYRFEACEIDSYAKLEKKIINDWR